MGADLSSGRNRKYKRMLLLGFVFLLFLTVCFFALLGWILSWKVLGWVILVMLALLLLPLVVCALIPFHPEDVILTQGNEALGDLDRRLLKLALDEGTTQEDIDAFVKDWDIEAAPIRSVMLVAYIMKTRPDLEFPATISPRLKGVLSFCRFQNLKREAHFRKVSSALSAEGIPSLVMKGGAMKVYRPDFPRWMNDIDMLVPASEYERAVDIAVSMGYGRIMVTDHSVDLHLEGSDEGLLDIHKHLEMFTGKEEALNDALFSRALKRNVFSGEGLVPCPEDMVFIALVNLYKNLAKNQTPESSLTTFFDIKYLIARKPDFDWSLVKDSAKKTGTEFQIYYSVVFLSSIIPDAFPPMLTESDLSDKEFENQLVDFLFKRDVLSKARDSFSQTSVGASFQKDFNPIVFMWVSLVSLLKRVFSIRAVKKTLLILRYRLLSNVNLS